MGYNLENTCNSCEECRHCGRGLKMYKQFFCDSCGENYSRDKLRQYEGENICRKCFLDMMDEEWRDLPEVKED